MNATAENWTLLHRSLAERWRPEDIIKYLLERPEASTLWSPVVLATLRGAIARAWFPTDSSMSTRFETARGPVHALRVARDLFPAVPALDPHAVADVERALAMMNAALGRQPGQDFKSRPLGDARPPAWRHHGTFNKRWRLAIALERKLATFRAHAVLTRLAQVAKSRLAHAIDWPTFARDARTAAFIAYYTASLNRRSLFTAGHQPTAYDVVAEALFLAIDPAAAPWVAVARVHPAPDVIARLSDAERGALLGEWFAIMREGAEILGRLAGAGGYDLARLVVARGNDSSTWNAAAGGYNRAREGWLACLDAIGMSEALDRFCPPKAMRLMAADVVAMHRSYGTGGVDPQTGVWQRLPKPWAVLDGSAECTRAMVEAACAEAGVPPAGWVTPRAPRAVAFTPTPELVHGVMVSSPALAAALRKAGWFAGPSKLKVEASHE